VQAESFFQFLQVNLLLLKKYRTIAQLLKGANIDINIPAQINSLQVSYIFLGNFWRLTALSSLMEGDSAAAMEYLRQAKNHYEKDESEWGLGLTYHMMARVADSDVFSKDYYEKAMSYFTQIDHYRGIWMSDLDNNSEKYKKMFE